MIHRALGIFTFAVGIAAACSATETSELGEDPPPASSSGNGGEGAGIQLGGHGGTTMVDQCKVPPDGDDAVSPTCDEVAPPDSFDPTVQWEWTAPPTDSGSLYSGSFVTPLVGNFTDDNNDGEVDLCDTPEILVTAINSMTFGGGTLTAQANGTIHALSGDTGEEKFVFQSQVDAFVYPAFGDIDGDMLPELVAADPQGRLIAFENDGSVKWTGDVAGYRTTWASGQCSAVAIYDLDGDGSPEILFGWEVFSATGQRLWGIPNNAAQYDGQYWCATPTAADLDGDGKLEVIFGHQTYHHDGSLYWEFAGQPPAHPHVADLDGDGQPEVFLTNTNGISVLEADGTVKFGPVRPTAPNPAPNCWGKPAVVHDFNGDSVADIAAATCSDYTVYDVGTSNVSVRWSANVSDASGLASATAFDFLGDAFAEAIYADETQIYVFDGENGAIQLTSPRQSGTLIEYPVVADVDNDASAEIVYVSNYATGSGPTITVVRDTTDRWIPARRIWNQYSYHVTNVREDSTIPATMKKSWLNLNTFRTNSQISAQGDCIPEPPK